MAQFIMLTVMYASLLSDCLLYCNKRHAQNQYECTNLNSLFNSYKICYIEPLFDVVSLQFLLSVAWGGLIAVF